MTTSKWKQDVYHERGGPLTYLHHAWVLVGRESVDVFFGFLTFRLYEAGEAFLHMIRPRNLLLPVAHIDLHHLHEGHQRPHITEQI